MVLPKHNVTLTRTCNFARDFKNCLLRGVATVLLVILVSETAATLASQVKVSTPLN